MEEGFGRDPGVPDRAFLAAMRCRPLLLRRAEKQRLVEAAGIEPASEGASTWASTCVVCPLVIRPAETRQTRFSASLGDCYSHRVIATPRLEVR